MIFLLGYDIYIRIEDDIEVLIEFKIKNQNKTTQDALNQIFTKGYYGAFAKGMNEKFILGIQLDATNEKQIFTALECLKHDGKGEMKDRSSWINIKL